MVRNVLLLLFFVLYVNLTFGQSVGRSAMDERRRALRFIEAKNYDAIDINNIKRQGVEYLNKLEQEIVLLFQRKFENLPSRIIENDIYFYQDGMFRLMEKSSHNPIEFDKFILVNDSLFQQIIRQFISEKELLLSDVDQSQLSDESKLFLKYYINFLDYQFNICDFERQNRAISSAKALSKEYPSSSYLVLPRKYSNRNRTVPYSFAAYGGFALTETTDGLSDHLQGKLGILLGLTFTWRNIEIGTPITLLTHEVKEDFEGVYTPYLKGRGITFHSTGLSLGYRLKMARSIELTPFVGYNNTIFKGLYFNDEDRDTVNFRRIKGNNFFAGFNLDWYFMVRDCQSLNDQNHFLNSGFLNSGLRFQFGVLSPNIHQTLAPLSGNVFYYGIGFVFKSSSFMGKRIRY